jgi:hypothetical protein
MYCLRLVLQADVFLERALHASSREYAIPSLEAQHSPVPSHQVDSLIEHQTEGSQILTSSLSVPLTNQPTTLYFESEPI